MLGRVFDLFTGNNRESLLHFIRRMLRELMRQDSALSLEYIDALGFDQLITSVPATIMHITEQHDAARQQGMDTSHILNALRSHWQTVLGSFDDGYAFDDNVPTESLTSFILHVVKRESHEAESISLTEQYVDLVIRETREFAKKNPRNTIQGTVMRRMKRRRLW